MTKHSLFALTIAMTPMLASAEITSAILYPSHAELTWEEPEQVGSGAGILNIEGLPVSLQDQTLQVQISCISGLQIQQVQVSRMVQAEFDADEARRIRQERAELTLHNTEKEDLLQASNQQVTLMSSAPESPHELSPSELNDMAVAFKDTTQSALSEISTIRARMT